MKKVLILTIFLFIVSIASAQLVKQCNDEGEFCGGIAGLQCCRGLICQLEGNYPDASGICVTEISKLCADSDGGKDYYKKGTVTKGSESQTDSCTYCTGACQPGQACNPTCGGVKEYYCENNIIKSEEYVCSNNCQDGACIFPSVSNLMSIIKTKGCIFSGLLSGIEDYNNYLSLLGRSKCEYIHRAVETWNSPPNFNTIQTNMGKVVQVKSNLIYGMFIAESIDTTKVYYYPDENRFFDFAAMCSTGTQGAFGPNTCKPSFNKEEYRKYLRYITRKAIDLGIQSFLFGQIFFQDDNLASNPIADDIVAEIKTYAALKSKAVVIGAQTNDISTDYIKYFDYIEGGLYQDVNGNIEEGACLSSVTSYCQALIWNSRYSAAKDRLVGLDWCCTDDDMHRFAKMTREKRAAFLKEKYSYFKSRGIGFLMTFRGIFNAGASEGSCYGYNKWVYSPDNLYSCKDENIINFLLSQKSCNSENEFCGGVASIPCCSGLTCKLEGNYPDASGICVKSTSECADSDGGKDYYKKGTVTKGSESQTDSCTYCTGACQPGQACNPTCGGVKEYYCENNIIKSEEYVCTNNCQDGACITSAVCANEGGFCGGIAGIMCCSDLKCQLEGNYPDAGGKCVKEASKCADSDGGKHYYIKGKCEDITGKVYYDYCDEEKGGTKVGGLEEVSCQYIPIGKGTSGTEGKTICVYDTYTCPYGCEAGACKVNETGCTSDYDGCCLGEDDGTCDPDCDEDSDPDCVECTLKPGDCCLPKSDNFCDADCPKGKDPDCKIGCNNNGVCELSEEEDSASCPKDCYCGDSICDSAENSKDCPKDCMYCTPEFECTLEPAECPEEGMQNRVCYDAKCGTGKKRVEAVRCVPGECTGCLKNKCYPVSTRLDVNGIPSYCDITKKFVRQKELGAQCQNNYECKSNECSDGKCISIKKELEETRSLLERVLEWIKSML